MKIRILYYFVLISVLIGCDPESTIVSTKPYKDTGTIKLTKNTYVIAADGGRMFVPIDLSSEFKVNNLRVEFEGTVEIDKTLPPNLEAIRLTSIKKL